MKNKIKKSSVVVGIVLSFFVGATVFASVEYVWKNNTDNIRQTITELGDLAINRKAEIAELNKQLDKAKQDIQNLKDQLNDANDKSNQEIGDLNNKIADLENEIKDKENKEEALLKEIDTLKNQLADKGEELDALIYEVQDIDAYGQKVLDKAW